MVGAVGLLATLADEFVGGDRRTVRGGAAGKALRECLSGMAREFFQGANKVKKVEGCFGTKGGGGVVTTGTVGSLQGGKGFYWRAWLGV